MTEPTPTGQAPVTPTDGGQASPSPEPQSGQAPSTGTTLTPEQMAAELKRTRDEAASHRVKAKDLADQLAAIQEQQRKADQDKLVEKEEFKILYEKTAKELEEVKPLIEQGKAALELLRTQQEQRKAALLEKLTPEQRTGFAHFSVEDLEKVVSIASVSPAPTGQTQTTQQQTPVPLPQVPFAHNVTIQTELQKALGYS